MSSSEADTSMSNFHEIGSGTSAITSSSNLHTSEEGGSSSDRDARMYTGASSLSAEESGSGTNPAGGGGSSSGASDTGSNDGSGDNPASAMTTSSLSNESRATARNNVEVGFSHRSSGGISSTTGSSTSGMNTTCTDMHDPLGLLQQSAYFAAAVAASEANTSSQRTTSMTDEERRQHRLESNRRSAKVSRHRRKILLDNLKVNVERLQEENSRIRIENQQLKEVLEEQRTLIHKILAIGKGNSNAAGASVVTSVGTSGLDNAAALLQNPAAASFLLNQHSTTKSSLAEIDLTSTLRALQQHQKQPPSLPSQHASDLMHLNFSNALDSFHPNATVSNPSSLLSSQSNMSTNNNTLPSLTPPASTAATVPGGVMAQSHVLNATNVQRLQSLLMANASQQTQNSRHGLMGSSNPRDDTDTNSSIFQSGAGLMRNGISNKYPRW